MTENGTFVINGTERVIVSQIIDPGCILTMTKEKPTHLEVFVRSELYRIEAPG